MKGKIGKRDAWTAPNLVEKDLLDMQWNGQFLNHGEMSGWDEWRYYDKAREKVLSYLDDLIKKKYFALVPTKEIASNLGIGEDAVLMILEDLNIEVEEY